MLTAILKRLGLQRIPAEAAPAPAEPAPDPFKITLQALLKFDSRVGMHPDAIKRDLKMPDLPPGVIPPRDSMPEADRAERIAQDDAAVSGFQYANQNGYCGLGFPGYAYLAELTQRSEYRSASETIAQEMTRKWIKFNSKGKGDYADKIKKIEGAFKKHRIKDLFRKAAEQDGFFGRAQIYINIDNVDYEQRKLPLIIDPATIKKGSLKGFKNIEAIWTTPYAYNSIDPTAPDFYKPRAWYIMGRQTHSTRLLSFISREVPDLLKPAYNFGGMSMSQLMEPYVNAWLRTRNSVSDLIHSFSTSGLATDMAATLEGGNGDDLFRRAQLFNQARDNRGMMIINKDTEEFFQHNTPLSGLNDLQAQSQEHMSAPSHIPLVKLFGISPAGLNASSEGEIMVFYDFVKACQEILFRAELDKVLKIVQLDLFGSIEEGIGYDFEPLTEMDGEALARVRKSDAEAGQMYIVNGVVSNAEERERLASDPNSGYNGLQVEDMPEMPDVPGSNREPDGEEREAVENPDDTEDGGDY